MSIKAQRSSGSHPSPDRRAEDADVALIALIVAGDERAFAALYDRHAKVTFSFAVRLLNDPGAAEDLVQESFLSVWRGAANFSPAKGSVRTWLLTMVHHRGVDRVRTRSAVMRREVAMQIEALVGQEWNDGTSENAIANAQFERVSAALGDLPKEQAEVLRLAYFGGFTHREIAEMLHLPLGTVKGRARLALKRLRKTIVGNESLA